MRKKKVHHEEHMDETWLIPYADMLTLLLALFIVMFAMSQVDKAKFAEMSSQFKIIFKSSTEVFAGGNAAIVNGGDLSEMGTVGESATSGTGLGTESEISSDSIGSSSDSGSGVIDYISEENWMKEIRNQLIIKVASSGYTGKIAISLDTVGLKISLQEFVLFQSGDAVMSKRTHPMLIEIGKMFQSIDNEIRIEGHTDNVPIHTEKFRSNWDLSAIRAINVMEFLIDKGGLRPERFSVQGFGEYSPKFDNSTEEGKAQNRRIEISLIRKYPPESTDVAVSK